MKKIIFGTIISLLSVATAEVRIAAVDMMKLARNHPDYERNRNFLQGKEKDLKEKLDAIKDEGEKLQTEGRKLAEQFRNPMLNDKMKAELEKKLSDIQQKLISIEQRYRSEGMRGRQDLQDDESRMLKATTDDLGKRIAVFAEAKGYEFVVDKNAVPYCKASFDITDSMLKEMGVDPEKARGNDVGK